MEVIFPHEIIFTTTGPVSVSDVANSLLANEQLLLHVGRLLEYCVDGLNIEKINVIFSSASVNSPLREALAAGILFTFQDDLKREVPKMIEHLTGIHTSEHYTTLITIIFLVVVIYGIDMAWDMFKNPNKRGEKQPVDPRIIGNYNTLITVAGDMIGVPPERVESALSHTFPPKQRSYIARTALAFIQPAKKEPGSRIEGGGQFIETPAIDAAPSSLDIALDLSEEEKQDPHEHADVVIHATDLDHGSKGWAGHIPGIWDKRLRMKLFPSIQPARMFGRDRVIADIILVSRRNEQGEYTPYIFHIVNVYD